MHQPDPCQGAHGLCFLLGVHRFRSYIQVFNPSWIDFYIPCRTGVCHGLRFEIHPAAACFLPEGHENHHRTKYWDLSKNVKTSILRGECSQDQDTTCSHSCNPTACNPSFQPSHLQTLVTKETNLCDVTSAENSKAEYKRWCQILLLDRMSLYLRYVCPANPIGWPLAINSVSMSRCHPVLVPRTWNWFAFLALRMLSVFNEVLLLRSKVSGNWSFYLASVISFPVLIF